MGIIRTQYPGTFDTSKFDYYYDPNETFSDDFSDDFDNIALEAGQIVIFRQETNTEDSMGRITAVTNTVFAGYGLLQDITTKDRIIHEMGLAVTGNRKGFFRPNYTQVSAGVTTTYTISEGDIVVDTDDVEWRIIKIIGERKFLEVTGFISTVIQKINLQGT